MTHLTMEQLLAVREPGLEPGVAGWRDHASACDLCRAELDRLDQRVARLRALPAPPAVPQPLRRDPGRRSRRAGGGSAGWLLSAGGLAVAASLALAVVLTRGPSRPKIRPRSRWRSSRSSIRSSRSSRSLEGTIQAYNPDQRVTDGRTARRSPPRSRTGWPGWTISCSWWT